MARCWEQRGCDEDMQSECPHAVKFFDRCPSKCAFAKCDRPTHDNTTDPALVFDPTVDRDAAIKEECLYCGFFLTRGPRIGETATEDTNENAEVTRAGGDPTD